MPVFVNTRQELFDELETAESSLAIVEYFAKWCKQCTESEKWIEQIEHEHPNTLVIRVDTDILSSYAKKMKVKAVPTFHFYSKNKVIDKFVGAKEEKVKELIQKNSRRGSRKSSAAPKPKMTAPPESEKEENETNKNPVEAVEAVVNE